jgi:PAS domain S-box-containing protein
VIGEGVYSAVLPEMERALAGETVSFERLIKYDNDIERSVRIRYVPEIGGDGSVLGVFATVVDADDKLSTEKALKASEERYRAFIAQSSEGIWRFELGKPMPLDISTDEQVAWAYEHGYLAECNDAMAKQYGFDSAEALAGVRLGDLLVKDDPNNTEFLKAFMQSGFRLNDAESHERDADGRDRYFLNNFVGIIENGHLARAWGTQRDITDSKSEERARERLAAIVESSDDAIFSFDLDKRVTSWNAAAERIYGYKSGEMLGQTISVLLPEDRVNEENTILERIHRGENIEHFETQRRRNDGRIIDVSLTISPIRDRLGRVVGVSKITRDISERKVTERALHENRLMLAMAMQSGRMGAWERDYATGSVTWSEELEEIFGLQPGEFRGDEEHFYSLIHEDDREATWAEVESAIIERRPYNIEFRFRHADGSIRWMEGRGEAVYSATGDPVRLYGIGLDITARKQTEELLQKSEERFRLALSSGAVTVYEQDEQLRYLWLYPSEPYPNHIIGKTDIDVEPGINGQNLYDLKQKVFRTGESCREEVPAIVSGEERWFDLLIEPRRDAEGKIVGVGGTALDVTVRRRVREELRRSEERLQAMFDTTSVGIAVLDTDAHFLQVNDAYCEITGYDRNELIHLNCADLTHPEDVPEMSEKIQRLLNGETNSFLLEKRYIRKNGQIVWVQDNVSVTHDANDRPLHLIAISQDVTARRKAENALRETEQRFSRFMQQLPGLAWIKDIDGRYVYANEAAQRSFGINQEQLYGKTDDEVFPPDSAKLFKEHDRLAVESGTGRQFLESLIEDDGVLHYSIVSKFPISDANDKPALIGGMAIDVTDQKQAEEELRQRMEFDEAVMSNMGEGLYTVDANGLVTSMNPAAEKLFGWSFEELRGKRMHDVIHYKRRDGTPFPAEECAALRVLGDGGDLINYEDEFIKKDGTFFNVLYSSSHIRSGGKTTGLVVVFQDITERKRAEEQLERYRHLSEYASDIILLLRSNGTIVEVNQAAVNMYGFTRDELVGMNVRRLRHPSTLNEVERQLDAARGGKVHFETVHVHKDGTELPVEVNASSAEFGGERLIMSILRDITDRKRREKDHEFLMRLADLIRIESDPSLLIAHSTRMLGDHFQLERCFVSAVDSLKNTSTVITEYKDPALDPVTVTVSLDEYPKINREAAMAGRTITVADTSTDKRTAERFETAYAPLEIRSYIAVPLIRDGKWSGTLFASKSRPYEWSEEQTALVQTVAERMWLAYEKLRSEHALRESERRATEEYQRLLERIVPLAETLGAARDLLTVYRSLQEFISASMDCSGFFVSFYDRERNLRLPAYIWGEGREIDVSQLPPMSVNDSGGPNSRAILGKQTVITNDYWEDQRKRPHVVLCENGVDPMSSLAVPMVVQDRVMGTLEVQAHKNRAFEREHAIALEMAANLAAVAIENVRLIQTEAKARAEAETANRMKDEFLSVLSHELRTPLNAMLGWVRILRGGNVDADRTVKALEIIERNTRQQSSLIEDLLDVSRIISGKMRIESEFIDLVPCLEQAAESVRPIAISKEIDFVVEAEREPLYLSGDAVRLQQLIINLLQNAIKFTSSGGKVELAWDREDSDVVITVTDTGIGIEKDFLPMMFDRFSQADASTRRNNTGLGLGLTIVRTIVDLHGGSITAFSDGPGTGAQFTVRLPLSQEYYKDEPSIPPAPLANGHSTSLEGVRILLVDDDEDGLVPLRILLEKESAIVTCVESAGSALAELRSNDYHILISDIGMPSMDGIELISELRNRNGTRNQKIKAIACTAYASDEDRKRVLSSGYHAHLSKPLDMDQLLTIVRKFGASERQADR